MSTAATHNGPHKRSRMDKRRRQTGIPIALPALPSIGSAAASALSGLSLASLGSKAAGLLKSGGKLAGKGAKGAAGASSGTQGALAGLTGGVAISDWLNDKDLGPLNGIDPSILLAGAGGLAAMLVLSSGGGLEMLTSPPAMIIGAGALIGGMFMMN